VLDIIVSGLSTEADSVNQDIEADDQESLKEHRELIEIYTFLLVWVLFSLESRTAEKPGTSATGRKTAKGKGKGKAGGQWDATAQMQAALEVTCKVLKLKLMRVFPTTPERDKIVELLTRPAYLILESEQRVKSMKMHVFKVLCIAIKHQNHALGKFICSPYEAFSDRNSCANQNCSEPHVL
jgi:condensin complex subunit 1